MKTITATPTTGDLSRWFPAEREIKLSYSGAIRYWNGRVALLVEHSLSEIEQNPAPFIKAAKIVLWPLMELRDLEQLMGLEGWRVEVETMSGEKRRFIVGRSTGWGPCHLELNNRRSLGGDLAEKQYKTVRKLYYTR